MEAGESWISPTAGKVPYSGDGEVLVEILDTTGFPVVENVGIVMGDVDGGSRVREW